MRGMMFASIFFICVAAAIVIGGVAKLRAAWFKFKFKQVAERYRGWLLIPWFGRPKILFGYGGAEANVTFKRNHFKSEGRQTRFSVRWDDRQFRMEVRSLGSMVPVKGAKLMSEYFTEDDGFGQRFRVWTNDHDMAKILLTSAVCWQLDQLLRNSQLQNAAVTMRRGKLVVFSAGYFRKAERLDDFVRLCLELFDQMQLSQSEGIEFINHLQAAVIQEMICPVCSSEIADSLVICIRCKTPHCKDCWQYNGQCATFSCGETRFATPVAGRPTATQN